jgi:hypothetical protein
MSLHYVGYPTHPPNKVQVVFAICFKVVNILCAEYRTTCLSAPPWGAIAPYGGAVARAATGAAGGLGFQEYP